MASNIPPSPWHSNDFSASQSSIDYAPPPTSGFEITMGPPRTGQRKGTSVAGAVITAILVVVAALFVVGQGAPGIFVIIPIVFALLFVTMAILSKKNEDTLAREAASEELEKQERLKSEIAEAVKESMKGNIKVRCRYCGSLNEESATKCDSCGATM